MKRFFIIVAMLLAVVCLASCAPGNTDKAKAKLEKKGYTVLVVTNKEVGENGEVATLTATTGLLSGNSLTATLYKSGAKASAALKETKNAEGETVCKKIGKWVVVGSEQAIKDFK